MTAPANPVHVAFTGTQAGMNTRQLRALRTLLRDLGCVFHHGGCIGADAQAHGIAMQYRYPVIVHPPSDLKKYARISGGQEVRPAKDYLIRNREMVDECTILFAAPRKNTEVLRSGTWATIRYARTRGLTIVMLWPNPLGPECDECGETLERFVEPNTTTQGWSCNSCGWSEEDPC